MTGVFDATECSKGFDQFSGRSELHVWPPPGGHVGDHCQCGEMVLRPIEGTGEFEAVRAE
jgi:hypothetical protein